MAPGKSGQLLEAFKFVVYLSVPVVVVAATSFYPSNLEWVIRNRSYVVYPEEAKRPPTGDEFYDYLKLKSKGKDTEK